jgi:hypothetical protein
MPTKFLRGHIIVPTTYSRVLVWTYRPIKIALNQIAYDKLENCLKPKQAVLFFFAFYE